MVYQNIAFLVSQNTVVLISKIKNFACFVKFSSFACFSNYSFSHSQITVFFHFAKYRFSRFTNYSLAKYSFSCFAKYKFKGEQVHYKKLCCKNFLSMLQMHWAISSMQKPQRSTRNKKLCMYIFC